jgi:nucleotidyltransferase substrate binding protein (TIGR01987 family)
MNKTEIRWKQRYANFQFAYELLREVLSRDLTQLEPLELEGAVQRFRFTFDMACKVLGDYLEFSGIDVAAITPRQVIKEAFSAKLIENGQVWIDMLDQRNFLSHTYDRDIFAEALKQIQAQYLPHLIVFDQSFDKIYNE